MSRPRLSLTTILSLAACSTGVIGEPGTSSTSDGQPQGPPGSASCKDNGPPIIPRLRRLSFDQYDRTASDLTGTTVQPSSSLGPEVEGMTPVLWTGFQTAAQQLAADPATIDRLLPCQPSGDGSDCAKQFATTVGRRAFRRSLTDAELGRYTALYASRADLTMTGTFQEGIRLMLEALLQSPNFLLRVERSTGALSGIEIASRLSYALWNGPPDDTLLSAADNGDLATVQGIKKQAQRMLNDPQVADRARAMLRASSRSWLGMVGAYAQFWQNTERDPTLFPMFYPGIDIDFREEVIRFVDHIVFDKSGGYADLFTSPDTVINAKLAPIYGISPAPSDWTVVPLDPDQRSGLLTRAGFVGTHGRATRGSLIFRGAFVLKRVLCQTLGSPPAGASSTPLPAANGMLRTTRQRIDAMTASEPCASCHHARINPAGYALEAFDGIGRFRTTDNGAPVDTTGQITLDGMMQSYQSPRDYSALLSTSSEAHRCYVDRFAELTFGEDSVDLGCTAQALAQGLGQPNATIKDFLAAFVTSDAFLARSTQEAQ